MNKIISLYKILKKISSNEEAKKLLKLIPSQMSYEDMEEESNFFPSEEEHQKEYEDMNQPVPIKKRLSDKPSFKKILEILSALGVRVFPTGKYGKLGSGSFGTVYSGYYNGKNVAVKIVITPISNSLVGDFNKSEYENDVKNWKFIESIRSEIPEKLKCHIPKIFLLDEGTFDVTEEWPERLKIVKVRYDYNIVVMELLKKIPSELANILEDSRYKGYESKATLDVLSTKITDAVNDFLSNHRIVPISEITIRKMILNSKEESLSSQELANKIISYLKNRKLNIGELDINDVRISIRNELMDVISKAIDIDHLTLDCLQPENRTTPTVKQLEFEGLHETLLWLADMGIEWKDLSSNNIMIGEDGHLKICDIGGYSMVR